MKKFILKPTMGTITEELAVIALPFCLKAELNDNSIVINTPAGTAESLAKTFESMLIDGYVGHWSTAENKVVLGAIAPTCVKLISTANGQEILYTRVTKGINGFEAVMPVATSRTVLRTEPQREK